LIRKPFWRWQKFRLSVTIWQAASKTKIGNPSATLNVT
jgi:hypothetical protein